MSDNDMTASTNHLENLALHQLLFLKVRDGGGPKVAHGVAELHGISVDELKAQCRRAGEEILAARGEFLTYEQTVWDWAKS